MHTSLLFAFRNKIRIPSGSGELSPRLSRLRLLTRRCTGLVSLSPLLAVSISWPIFENERASYIWVISPLWWREEDNKGARHKGDVNIGDIMHVRKKTLYRYQMLQSSPWTRRITPWETWSGTNWWRILMLFLLDTKIPALLWTKWSSEYRPPQTTHPMTLSWTPWPT